jgi:UPF0042 nucleotide-binding protein
MTTPRPRIIFVSGLSGSGKSTAMAALEDLGFYCADNLPMQLVGQFIDLCGKATPPIEKIGLAIDSREAPFLPEFPSVVRELRSAGHEVEVLFLEASVQVLENRYRETRRVHPLAPDGPVERGIEAERELLGGVAKLADHEIDTSSLNVHQLKSAVSEHVSGNVRPIVVNLVSFGFRYGTPQIMEMLFDVRFLPNPYFDESLRAGTGLDPEVSRYALESPRGAAFFERLCGWLEFLLPMYDAEGKAYVTIGVGCTGGRHRSVAVVEALAAVLRDRGRDVNVDHLDMGKSG